MLLNSNKSCCNNPNDCKDKNCKLLKNVQESEDKNLNKKKNNLDEALHIKKDNSKKLFS